MLERGVRLRWTRPVAVLGALALAAALGSTLSWAAGSESASSAAASSGPQAQIRFANFNVYDWAADGQRGIYIQTLNRKWYYAKLLAPCINLPFALRVGFVTEPGTGTFDRFSSIIVQDQQCPVVSLTESEPPPTKDKRWREHRGTKEAEAGKKASGQQNGNSSPGKPR